MKKMQQLIQDARNLPMISESELAEFESNKAELLNEVNHYLVEKSRLNDLIGNSPVQVMTENNQNHFKFMVSVFNLTNYELLVRTIPWVYQTYISHQFSTEFFPTVLQGWIFAIKKVLKLDKSAKILEVYDWILKHHDSWLELSKIEHRSTWYFDAQWSEVRDEFLEQLLQADHRRCLDITRQHIQQPRDVSNFFIEVIQPSLYEIGLMWQQGRISVAQEHLASANVNRILSAIQMMDFKRQSTGLNAVVTAGPNEYHEIGARMISDLLELEGWNVQYLGANTPVRDLIQQLKAVKPELLVISVSLASNLLEAKRAVSEIRQHEALTSLKIMLGGYIINQIPDLWKATGVNGSATNARSAIQLTQKWFS